MTRRATTSPGHRGGFMLVGAATRLAPVDRGSALLPCQLSLGAVVAEDAEDLAAILGGDRLLQRLRVRAGVEGLLGQAQRQRRLGRQNRGNLEGASYDPLRRRHLADQAD